MNIEKSLTNTYTNIADIQVCMLIKPLQAINTLIMGIKFLEKDANDEFVGVLSTTKLSFLFEE